MDRKIDQILGRNTVTPAAPQSLSASLLSKRTAQQSEPKNSAAVKLTAVTTKEKQKFLDKTFTKGHATSSIQLLKMRQMANKGLHNEKHFLGDKARGFLHRSAGGVKLQGEELKKFIEAGIQGEIEATEETLSNPLEFHVRNEGTRHLSSKANVLIRKLKKEAEHQAALQKPKPDELAMRRERLDTLHARLATPNQPQSTAAAVKPAAYSPMPLGTITPLSSGGGSHQPAVSRYLNTAGGHTPNSFTPPGGSGRYSPSTVEPTSITTPANTTTEKNIAPPVPSVPTAEPTTSAEPMLQDPEPLDDSGESIPAHPVVPTESAPMGDALGGSGDEE